MTIIDTDAETVHLHSGAAAEPSGGRYDDKVRRLMGASRWPAAAAGTGAARKAVDAAAVAARRRVDAPPGEHRRVLDGATDLLDERADAIMGRELDASSSWCHVRARLAAGMLREAAAEAYSAVGQVIASDVPGPTALGGREPVGAVVGITSWNAPLILGMRAIARPLAYGNSVVVTTSEETPAARAAIIDCLIDAGVPAAADSLITNAPSAPPPPHSHAPARAVAPTEKPAALPREVF